jgi:two-component system, chemotaxis family, CheB/CheR fusion protein
MLDVQIAPLSSPSGDTVGASITFGDVTRFNRLREEAAVSKRQLETAYEELQSTVESLRRRTRSSSRRTRSSRR